MAVRLELTKDQAEAALDKEIASIKRSITGAKPAFKELYTKELAQLTTARNTITEIK